jgi:hypothetical protein
MKLVIGFLIVMVWYFWNDMMNALFYKTPKTYNDLMKLPAFMGDTALQQRLKDQRELEREKEKSKRERESRMG